MVLLGLIALASASVIPQEEYKQRRERLKEALPQAAVVVFASADTASDPRSPMLADANFYYLTGWREPGAILLLLPQGRTPDEILFLPPRNERLERYEGKRAAAGDAGVEQRTGFACVLSTEVFKQQLRQHSSQLEAIYTAGAPVALREALRTELEGVQLRDASTAIARLRMVKSARELALIERAAQVSMAAHLAAWRRLRPGLFEYQLAATFTFELLERGCQRPAYRLVFASGSNGVILHYAANHRRMEAGELVVMDAGAECGGYAADITRTLPVGGRFSARHRELYELVLGAQKAAIAAAKSGETLGSRGTLTEVARQYMNRHGKPIRGRPPGDYFTHAIGHHVGLEVHDASLPEAPLAPGSVFMIEPGLYIPEEGIGIRIEDMLVATETGARVLTEGLPKEVRAIERFLAR